jgi:hypothetical protein
LGDKVKEVALELRERARSVGRDGEKAEGGCEGDIMSEEPARAGPLGNDDDVFGWTIEKKCVCALDLLLPAVGLDDNDLLRARGTMPRMP